MATQFHIPANIRWLYPENQGFVAAKLAGENAEPVHHDEVLAYYKDHEILFLSSRWFALFTTIGIICLLVSIGFLVFLIWFHFDRSIYPIVVRGGRSNNPIPIIILASLIIVPMWLGLLRWAWNAYPYLKYPSVMERHYRQLLERGKFYSGVVEMLAERDTYTQVKYSLRNGREKRSYDTFSPNAKTLKEGDTILIFKHGDYAIML